MGEDNIEELKKRLKKVFSSEEDLAKLALVKTPEDLLGLMAKVGGELTKKMEIELKTRDLNEPFSDTLTKLISLRREAVKAVHLLKDEKQQKLLDEHWENILQGDLQLVVQENKEMQKEAKGDTKTDRRILLLLQQFENETGRLETLQRQQSALCAQGQSPNLSPTPTPDSNLRAQVKEIIGSSKLLAVAGSLGSQLTQKFRQLTNRQDSALSPSYTSPTPFSTKLTPEKY